MSLSETRCPRLPSKGGGGIVLIYQRAIYGGAIGPGRLVGILGSPTPGRVRHSITALRTYYA
jgi:hypothetical protein